MNLINSVKFCRHELSEMNPGAECVCGLAWGGGGGRFMCNKVSDIAEALKI